MDMDGIPFCIEKELLTTIGGATIDLTYMGFSIEPEIPLAAADGGCGGSCSTGSCGI